jgi:hypothetical protein
MTFNSWFEADGRQAVSAANLDANGSSVRAICERAFAAGQRYGAQLSDDAAAAAGVHHAFVAHYYLLGVVPIGTLSLDPGRSRGQAWLDARVNLRRFLRPFMAIEVRG